MLAILLLRVALFGGLAYFLADWLVGRNIALVVAVIAAGSQFLKVNWAISRGATTCHACGLTFVTR